MTPLAALAFMVAARASDAMRAGLAPVAGTPDERENDNIHYVS